MDKEPLIEEFFRSLRVTLTNAFSYPKDHPYFIKSVENFKTKLDDVLVVLNPFKAGVTSCGLIVDGKNLTKTGFYDELARLLHQRKIKSLEIRSGASLQELIQFFSVISLSQKEIFKKGGINALLDKNQLNHFIIEELDYSAFLHGQGKECADIWGYMLKEAATSDDSAKVDKLADDFGSYIKQANEKDIFQAEEVSANINEFLICLKEKNKDKFEQCSKDIFLWLLNNKQSINDEKLAKIKAAFEGLNQDDLSNLLLEGILQEDSFDALSLQLFSKISEQKNPQKISEGFFNKASASGYLKNNPHAVKRIQNLLVAPGNEQMSAVYRNTLESLAKEISSFGILFFDQKLLKENYRYIILSMFSTDTNNDSLKLEADLLEKELPEVFKENDFNFFKELQAILVRRKEENIPAVIDFEKKFSAFIEDLILNQVISSDQESLAGMVTLASQGIGLYLDKIFNSEKFNPQILGLFLRLFQNQTDAFYLRLNQKQQDLEFLDSLIQALSRYNLPVTLEILKHIYFSSNDLIKSEILKVMRKFKLTQTDLEFFKGQLNTNSPALKKGLLAVLILNAPEKSKILELLLKIPSSWGSQNNLLIENMQIIFDLRINEAVDYIRDLSQRRFFWNKKLRDQALQILKEWNVK